MGYVFYDTETSGLNKHHDEILQFAAIVTDEHFAEVKRFEVKLRLSPLTIPSPRALYVNGTPVSECFSPQRLSQFDGMKQIHDFITQNTPATFAGWNTVGFDEECLRHGFYRQLLGAYPTSMGGNARMDILGIARAIDALRPGSIVIPTGTDGKKSFKLQDVCIANGYNPRAAHEAMSDVEACLTVAALLKHRQPEIWSAFVQTSRKPSAMEVVQSKTPFVVIDGWKDYTRSFVGIEIGRDPNPNLPFYSYVLDLDAVLSDFDPSDLTISATWFDRHPAPMVKVRCNASPLIVPIDDLEEYDDIVDDLTAKAHEILKDTVAIKRIAEAFHDHIQRDYPNSYVEDKLYSGFPDPNTEQKTQQFRNSNWVDRARIARSIQDARYLKLAMRLVAEHAPDELSVKERNNYEDFVLRRRNTSIAEGCPWMSLERAQHEISLLPEPDDTRLKRQFDNHYGRF